MSIFIYIAVVFILSQIIFPAIFGIKLFWIFDTNKPKKEQPHAKERLEEARKHVELARENAKMALTLSRQERKEAAITLKKAEKLFTEIQKETKNKR